MWMATFSELSHVIPSTDWPRWSERTLPSAGTWGTGTPSSPLGPGGGGETNAAAATASARSLMSPAYAGTAHDRVSLRLRKRLVTVSADGGRPESPRRAEPAPDPAARAGRGADGRRDRLALRGLEAGGLAAPDRAQGGRARARTTKRNAAPLQRPARGARRCEGVPRGLLGREARGAQARSGTRGEEEAWKARLNGSPSRASS